MVSEQGSKDIRALLVDTKPSDIKLDDFVHLYRTLLESLMTHDAADSAHTTSADTLSVWLQRAVQYCSLNPEQVSKLSDTVSDDDANAIFNHVLDFWTDSGAALGNALKELYLKIILLLAKVRPESRALLQQWTVKILAMPKNMRVVYFSLEILARHVGGHFILEIDPDFPDKAFELMSVKALANQIGKALYAIYHDTHKTMTEDAWVKSWSPSARMALHSDPLTRSHVQTYFLPQMFKLCPTSFAQFIAPLLVAFDQDDQEKLTVLVGCLKVGQDISLEIPSTIGIDLLRRLLRHSFGQLRVDGLSLLVSSPQASKPVSSEVLAVVKEHMDDLLVEVDAGTRNQTFGLLRQFVFRLRQYSYSVARDMKKEIRRGQDGASQKAVLDEIEAFLKWYISYLTLKLRPGTPYNGLFSSTRLLTTLVRSGLDSRVDSKHYEKQHIDFPFTLPIYTPTLTRLLVDNMSNNYDDIRKLSAKILKMGPTPIPGLESKDSIDQLVSRTTGLLSGMRGREGDGAAQSVALAFYLYDRNDAVKCLNDLMTSLEEKIDFASSDFVTAVHTHPVHGYYTALRVIFESVDFAHDQLPLEGMVHRIIQSASKVWKIVEMILCHDSPEGNLPEELTNLTDLEERYGPATQVILSYSWRAIKESTALLESILRIFPDGFLPDDDIIDIGQLVLSQLATVRHRGAFSSVYPTFTSCCKRCYKRESLKSQPELWLSENLKLVRTKSQYITRRSGGLPYLIASVLAADPDPEYKLLHSTFNQLTEISNLPANSADEKMDLPQVHAFNCIKFLFVESELSTKSAKLIDNALDLAISHFSHEIWSIRNCALMLFTALQGRLFGPMSEQRMSARLFFSRHKRVKPILLEHLQKHVSYLSEQTKETSRHVETVYPVLTILSRLEGVKDYTGLDEFKPLIFECLRSKIWKVREMAARTVPALTSSENPYLLVREIIQTLSSKDKNDLHGKCLALQSVALNYEVIVDDKIMELVEKQFVEFVVNSSCASTAVAYLRAVKLLSPDSLALEQYCSSLPQPTNGSAVDAESRVLRKELAEVVLANTWETGEEEPALALFEQLLFDNAYEVQLYALEFIESNVERGTAFGGKVCEMLWKLFETANWDQIRGPAVRQFSRLCDQDIMSKNRDLYWKRLYDTLDDNPTEEIAESAIEALGYLTGLASDNAQTMSQWITKVRAFCDEDEEYPSRVSGLKSLAAFVETAPFESIHDDIILLLYFLQTDDDVDVRDTAAEMVSSLLSLGASVPTFAEKELFSRLPESYIFNLFKGSDKISLEQQLQDALKEDDLLFTIEKSNLFRNELALLDRHSNALKRSAAVESAEFKEWATQGLKALTKCFNAQGDDGPLGWTSASPDVFFVLRKIVLAADLAKLDIEEAKAIAQKHQVHPCVFA